MLLPARKTGRRRVFNCQTFKRNKRYPSTTSASMNGNDINATEVLTQLKSGTILFKQKNDGKKRSRRFFLHEHESFISYDKSRRLFGRPHQYNIGDIDEVRSGFRAQTFGDLVKKGVIKTSDENRALTIMYNNHRNEIHLMAPNPHIRDLWAKGIQSLVDRNAQKSQQHLIKEENWILSYFHTADTDKSNSLSKRECRRLLSNSLSVEVPDNLFENLFQKADKSQEGLLSPDEFVGFFNLLTQREDLYTIMQEHKKSGNTQPMEKINMNIDELLKFLRTIQNQRIAVNKKNDDGTTRIVCECIDKPEQGQELINEFELDKDLKQKGLLGLDGFRNMLLSSDFSIVKPYYSRQIYQDMTRPLCDYYVNTSHNTYLFYGQLSGDSNPEAYNRALCVGCRAVELDCYDGNDGAPIVTHAFTLVRPCSFESIIRYMEPNLFKTSPYPIILNIENHCSTEQQKEMARILKEILGDRLVTKALFEQDPTVLPSPEDLKYKVIIRSKKHAPKNGDHSHAPPKSKEDDLSELFIYLKNVPFREAEHAEKHYSPLQSSSLAENRFEKISRETPDDLISQTTWRMIRMYPGGLRQDSSNANPVDAWNYGIQMAALNFQNEDHIMPLCYGKFLDNGGCGYVLKPNYLTHARETGYNPLNPDLDLDESCTLTLKIISAQFLSRLNQSKSDVPDPYVTVSIHGLPCDQQSQKTAVIENNGLDPQWYEKFTFQIRYPQMALVYFSIYDYNAITADERLAHFCLPLTMMQTGYRHVRLRADNNDLLHSTLFVRVEIRKDGDHIISTRL